ncbi:MAG TPA: hydrogenase iron-sulfur subunit [Thermodesulfobacteriota bacterium]|nr:hydrogenase iron-sulfur subunit [Thermodesulfobacteriota bacterium]
MNDFTPKLVCFSCKFGWGYLNQNGYENKFKRLVPVTCSGKVTASQLVEAFQAGADGVIILGCPEGECHFQNGNYQARKRVLLLQKTLGELGIEPQRVKIKLSLDPEGAQIPAVIEAMTAEIRNLGPLTRQRMDRPPQAA